MSENLLKKTVRAKSPDAFRTIGETAELVGVPQHVLRFWETKFHHIKPQKHRGRRYYRSDVILALQQIKTLLYKERYTIKEVIHFLSKQGNMNSVDDNQPDFFIADQTVEEVTITHPTGAIALSKYPLEVLSETGENRDNVIEQNFVTFYKEKLAGILEGLRQSRDKLGTALQE